MLALPALPALLALPAFACFFWSPSFTSHFLYWLVIHPHFVYVLLDETITEMSTLTGGRGGSGSPLPVASTLDQRRRFGRPTPYPSPHQYHYATTSVMPSSPYGQHINGPKASSSQSNSLHRSIPPHPPRYHPRATIIIIGMRGTGKVSFLNQRSVFCEEDSFFRPPLFADILLHTIDYARIDCRSCLG